MELSDFIPKAFRDEIEEEMRNVDPAFHKSWLSGVYNSQSIWQQGIELELHHEFDNMSGMTKHVNEIHEWFDETCGSIRALAGASSLSPIRVRESVEEQWKYGVKKKLSISG